MTRRNDRTCGVANRDVWHVNAIAPDGSLALRHHRDGRSTIVTAGYVAEHVELAYAMTVHAAQGRTADTGHLVVTTGLDRELLYVGMTRGRGSNHAWIVTEDFLHPEVGGGTITLADAIRAIVRQEPAVVSATEALRTDLDAADSLRVLGPIHDDLAADVTRRQTLSYLNHRFGASVAGDVADDPAGAALVALLRRAPAAGVEPMRLLAHASRGDLGGAESAAQVLAARTGRLLERLASGDVDPARLDHAPPGWEAPHGAVERYHQEIGNLMDERARTLGERAAADAPAWAVGQWGPVPTDPLARAEWARAAGALAAYRERWGTDLAPRELSESPPHPRSVAQWTDYQRLRRWLDLDRNDIADIAQTGPDADRNGTDDRTQTGPDLDANGIDDALDAALARLAGVQPGLPAGHHHDPVPAATPDLETGPAPARDLDFGP